MTNGLTASWENMMDRLQTWVDMLITNIPNIALAIFAFVLFLWISSKVQYLLRRPLRRFVGDESIKNLIIRFIAIAFVGLGLIMSLGILNLDTALKSILAGAGVAGLAVGLALQGTLSNTFAGIILSIRKVVNIGDWIETNGYAGSVQKISLRNTSILEADNNIVVIPNKDIIENPFKNYGLTSRIRTIINCGIGYEEDLEKVKQVAIKAIGDRFPQEHGEEIEFFYTGFGDSSINFVLRFWVEAREKLTILGAKSEAIMTLKSTFDKHEINIPFPIRTLELRNQVLSKQITHVLENTN